MDDPTRPIPGTERDVDPDPDTEPQLPAVQPDRVQPDPVELQGVQPDIGQREVAAAAPAWPSGAPVAVAPAPMPGSVVGAAVVLLVMGVLAGLLAVVLFLSGTTYDRLPNSSFGGLSPDQIDQARRLGRAFVTGFAVVAGVVALGHLASGIGVLRRAGWGRILGMVFAGIGLLFTGLLALLSAVVLTAQLPATVITDSGMTQEQYEQVARLGGIVGIVIFGVCALAYLFTLIALIRNGRTFG